MKKALLIILISGLCSLAATAQKVGITDATGLTPQSLLHVHSATAGQLFQLSTGTTPTANSGFNISVDASKNIVFNQYEAAKMAFYTNNTERLTILSGGNVGIGTASPASKLDINGNLNVAAGNGTRVTIGAPTSAGATMLIGRLSGNPSIKSSETYLMLEGGGASGIVGLNYYATGAVLLAYGGGNVGIGTTTPAQKLDVNGVVNAATGYRIANAAATGGNYLRGNGTNFVASGIQVSDVPILNQNTTGTAANVTGIIAPANGGTGVNNGSNTLIIPASGTAVLGTGTAGYATYWSTPNTLGSEQHVSVARGGLGANMTAGAAGAIPYSTGTTAYSTLTAVATGNALLSGGAGAAPAWGKIGLTSHVSGTLPVGNGGTGANSLTGYVYGNGAGAMTASTTIPTSALSSSTITVSSSGTGLSITGSPVALGGTVTVNSNATSANTASTLVARDGSGNFSASQINANLLGLLKMTDNRVISPSEIAAGSLQFGFTSLNNNNTAPYGDFLHLRSYNDASGGNDNLIVFRKDAIGMRIYQQAFGSATAYSTYKDVAFTQDVATGYIQNQTASDQAAGFRINGNGLFNGGSVGIGTISPGSQLTVLKSAAGGRGGEISIVNYAATTTGNSAALNFGLESSTYAGNDGNAQIQAILNGVSGASTDITFSLWSGSAFNEYMRINSAGNVGIGTTSPGQKLVINGGNEDITASGGGLRLGANNWSDAGPTYGHIITSNSGHNALMIVGNNVAGNSGHGREVKVWDYLNVQGGFNITGRFYGVGTTDLVSNLNSDLLDGQHGSYYSPTSHTHTLDNVCDVGNTTDQTIYSTNSSAFRVNNAAGNRSIYYDGNNYYSPVSHSGHSWFRNNTGNFTFQPFDDSDDWTRSFQLYLPDPGSSGGDNLVAELGQRVSNISMGSYKGLRIVHFSGSAVSDGFLQAGNAYFSGNVGIGTSTPADRLDVRDAMSVNEIKFRNVGGGDDSDPYRLRKVQGSSNTNWLELQLNDDNNEEFRIYGNSCSGYSCAEYSGNLYHFFRADGTAYHAGNVGIGTTSPSTQLHTTGGIRFQSLAGTGNRFVMADASGNLSASSAPSANIVSGNGEATRVAFWSDANTLSSNANLYWDNTNSRLGIGTTTPESKLDIRGTADLTLRNTNTLNNSGDDLSMVNLGDAYNGSQVRILAERGAAGSGGDNPTDISFWNTPDGSTILTERMRINYNGNVGIGTTSPGYKLHINGGTTYDYLNSNQYSYLGYSTAYTNYAYHKGPDSSSSSNTWAGYYYSRLYNYTGSGSYSDMSGAIKGYVYWGREYSAGVQGWNWGDDTRCSGVQGYNYSGGTWGALGYKTSGSTGYGVYGSTVYASGGGYMESQGEITGIGLGASGGVMGGWSRGEVLGFTSAGELYASYNLGNEYTSGVSADIVTNNDERMPAYSVTSNEVKVYCDGKAKLINGYCKVSFDRSFIGLVSTGKEPTVTVSALGESEGIYIASIDKDGFVVKESRNGQSNIEFTWIAIGARVDAIKVSELPEALKDKNFDNNMKGVMFNENNKEQSATPIWWDGNKIRFDKAPEQKVEKKEEHPMIPNHKTGNLDNNDPTKLWKEQQEKLKQEKPDPNAPIKSEWDNPPKLNKELPAPPDEQLPGALTPGENGNISPIEIQKK